MDFGSKWCTYCLIFSLVYATDPWWGPGPGAPAARPRGPKTMMRGEYDGGGLGGDSLEQFASYEDYLDAQVSETDMYYLEDEELARQLVELGYRGSGDTLKRDEFEAKCLPATFASADVSGVGAPVDLDKTIAPGGTP